MKNLLFDGIIGPAFLIILAWVAIIYITIRIMRHISLLQSRAIRENLRDQRRYLREESLFNDDDKSLF